MRPFLHVWAPCSARKLMKLIPEMSVHSSEQVCSSEISFKGIWDFHSCFCCRFAQHAGKAAGASCSPANKSESAWRLTRSKRALTACGALTHHSASTRARFTGCTSDWKSAKTGKSANYAEHWFISKCTSFPFFCGCLAAVWCLFPEEIDLLVFLFSRACAKCRTSPKPSQFFRGLLHLSDLCLFFLFSCPETPMSHCV